MAFAKETKHAWPTTLQRKRFRFHQTKSCIKFRKASEKPASKDQDHPSSVSQGPLSISGARGSYAVSYSFAWFIFYFCADTIRRVCGDTSRWEGRPSSSPFPPPPSRHPSLSFLLKSCHTCVQNPPLSSCCGATGSEVSLQHQDAV